MTLEQQHCAVVRDGGAIGLKIIHILTKKTHMFQVVQPLGVAGTTRTSAYGNMELLRMKHNMHNHITLSKSDRAKTDDLMEE
jgi:hypothetical protein